MHGAEGDLPWDLPSTECGVGSNSELANLRFGCHQALGSQNGFPVPAAPGRRMRH